MAFQENSNLLFDFNKQIDSNEWFIVNEGVMGGLSKGDFSIDKEGHGWFKGNVSLDNYGGFTSVRHRPNDFHINTTSTIRIRLKGDGKSYQVRIKSDLYQRHSYVTTFNSSGEWEEIDILLDGMVPTFRGRRLNMENFGGDEIAEITFLIGNKKEESFNLKIDYISLIKN